MSDAGYNVTVQTYQFDYYAYTGIPSFSANGHEYVLGTHWYPGQSLGSINEEQPPLVAAGAIVLPPTPLSSSTSGCTPADFPPESVKGHPVLVKRGGCNFGVKVLNAQAAGATGVVIFNEGNPGRTGLIVGSMLGANDQPFRPGDPGRVHHIRHRAGPLQPDQDGVRPDREHQRPGDHQAERR